VRYLRSSARSRLSEMSGISPRVRQPNEFADPGFTSIPSVSAQCTLPSLFWLLYKIELSFIQEFRTKVFTGGWKFVTLNSYKPSSEAQKFVMNVNMQLICIFWVKLFRQKNAKFFRFLFDLRKAQCVEKISRISKSAKKPRAKTAKFKNLQKSKILNPALGVHYSGCSVVSSATS